MNTSALLQIKMLELLIERDKEERGCTTNTFIKETGGDKKEIKEIIKTLKQSEMIEVDWCIDDDGMLSGRAFFLTRRATQWSVREWLEELKEMHKEELDKIMEEEERKKAIDRRLDE